jgi:hypothetical protein
VLALAVRLAVLTSTGVALSFVGEEISYPV